MPNNEKLIENQSIEQSAVMVEPETPESQELLESPDSARPDWLPLKFWDAKQGEVRIQALAKSYKLLEQRLSSKSAEKLVEKENEKANEPSEEIGEDILEDIVADSALDSSDSPDSIAASLAATAQLEQIFGVEKWQRLRPQLLSWGRHNLPESAFDVLSSSVEGIRALHRLMSSQPTEPRLVEGGDLPQALDESRLRRMMEDPRYWRERDPDFVNRVLRGFQQLYGS